MYLLSFSKRIGDHDFTLISETIAEYYPDRKGKRLTPEAMASSPRFKKISDRVKAEYINQRVYRAKWGKLTAHLKKVFKKPVYGYPSLYDGGGFTGEIVVSETKLPDFSIQKTLQFHISIIGPFFAIHGIDSSTALLSMEPWPDKGNFAAKHAVTTSPANEYSEKFKALEREIRAWFPGYHFVPYHVGMSTIRNISVADQLRDPRSMDTVYEAIFSCSAVHECPARGDERYGMDTWLKPFSKKEKAMMALISQHAAAGPTEVTVHKVWKLQSSRQLNLFKQIMGNVLFGVELCDIVDLTDKATLIVVPNKGRATPSSVKYKVRNNVIKLSKTISLEIIKVGRDTATMHLLVNFRHKEIAASGPAFEMNFVQMKKV